MSEEDPLEYQHAVDLRLIQLGEQLQEHFNQQILDRGLSISAEDPTVRVMISSGWSTVEVDDHVIWSSDTDGEEPDLESLINAFEVMVNSLAKHVRPGRLDREPRIVGMDGQEHRIHASDE